MTSFRSDLLIRRTYSRPLNPEGTIFETWPQTVDRVINHQRWLWERALEAPLNDDQEEELRLLKQLILSKKVMPSGRTLWLGGTATAMQRESTQFNCSFLNVQTIYDVVDGFWLLLQGCGVGFMPMDGVLNGFTQPISDVEVIRSTKVLGDAKGYEHNVETLVGGVWTIRVGDSAEAWAKLPGKILAQKRRVKKLVLDFSEIRAAGYRLSGYGWISSGDGPISKAIAEIVTILNYASGRLLTKIDILDIMNWLGTALSSRRSAEIALMNSYDLEIEAFIRAKTDLITNPQRTQSNNTVLFAKKPTREELLKQFFTMVATGGSEPGFGNEEQARARGPWFSGFNPCAEILLGDKSFCNLVEINISAFIGREEELFEATRLIARANYRQTCVNLKDGVLSDSWHDLNQYLRLCGVGITGIVRWMDAIRDKNQQSEILQVLRKRAKQAVDTMAHELDLPEAKLVTTIKPSGTLSKVMECPEGAHRPRGKFVFNTVNISAHDPLVPLLEQAGYDVSVNPYDDTGRLVVLPVSWEDLDFIEVDGLEINTESAVDQLNRYKFLMDNYVDHNCSITVSYDPSEIREIVDWLEQNWDSYVGVSWLLRDDPHKTAEDLGYAYLPQKVVDKQTFDEYTSRLHHIDINKTNFDAMITIDECATGACPVR